VLLSLKNPTLLICDEKDCDSTVLLSLTLHTTFVWVCTTDLLSVFSAISQVICIDLHTICGGHRILPSVCGVSLVYLGCCKLLVHLFLVECLTLQKRRIVTKNISKLKTINSFLQLLSGKKKSKYIMLRYRCSLGGEITYIWIRKIQRRVRYESIRRKTEGTEQRNR